MKTLIAIGLIVGLGGCAKDLTSITAENEAVRLCADAASYYAKIANPSKLQAGAKHVLDAACRDPAATADVIVSVYKVIAANKG